MVILGYAQLSGKGLPVSWWRKWEMWVHGCSRGLNCCSQIPTLQLTSHWTCGQISSQSPANCCKWLMSLQGWNPYMSYSAEVTYELIYCPGHKFIGVLPPTSSLSLLHSAPEVHTSFWIILITAMTMTIPVLHPWPQGKLMQTQRGHLCSQAQGRGEGRLGTLWSSTSHPYFTGTWFSMGSGSKRTQHVGARRWWNAWK